MALIKCPECGKEVSDRADNCPNCAFPLSTMRTDGEVSIKLPIDLLGTMRVLEVSSREVLWSGPAGQIAKFAISRPTEIGIMWGVRTNSGKFYPGATAQVQAGKKYELRIGGGFFGDKASISEVDVFDSGR